MIEAPVTLTKEKRAEYRRLANGVCVQCDMGFPLKDGVHFGTQALGMIPNTACGTVSGLLARARSVGEPDMPLLPTWRIALLSLLDELDAVERPWAEREAWDEEAYPFGGTCSCQHAYRHDLPHERGCAGYREPPADEVALECEHGLRNCFKCPVEKLNAAERAVVEAAVGYFKGCESDGVSDGALLDATDRLLRLRQRAEVKNA